VTGFEAEVGRTRDNPVASLRYALGCHLLSGELPPSNRFPLYQNETKNKEFRMPMMKKNRFALCVFPIVLVLAAYSMSAWSQQETTPYQPDEKVIQDAMDAGRAEDVIAELSRIGPKNKAFFDSLTAFKSVDGKIHTLMLEYQTAKPERKDQIQEEYDKLLVDAKQARNNLIDAAMDAFNEAPYYNFIVAEFCISLIQYENARDNFEVSFKLADAIIAHPDGLSAQAGDFYVMAADSAFGCMEFDKAEQWYAKAVSLNARLDREAMMRQRETPEQKKLWAEELTIREKEAQADNNPRVLIRTNKGDITIELFEDNAPNTVANFISLVKRGFYKDIPFHRVLPGFMAQGGGECGYCIDCERLKKDLVQRKHFRGSISMARTGMPDTGGSQFFQMFQPKAYLNGEYTVFGRIIDGIDILADIQRIDPDDEVIMVEPDRIIEMKVLRDRGRVYEPVKNNIRLPR